MDVRGEAKCLITDGTEAVNLLAPGFGFHIEEWRPQTPEPRDGGVWQESSLTDGRRLVDQTLSNAIETFKLKLNGRCQDDVIREMRRLRGLLERASLYWRNSRGKPVYLVTKAAFETHSRYAIIMMGRVAEDNNPFAMPFVGSIRGAVLDDLTLVIERDHWQANPPSQLEAQPAEATMPTLPLGWRIDGNYSTPSAMVQFDELLVIGCDNGYVYLTSDFDYGEGQYTTAYKSPADFDAVQGYHGRRVFAFTIAAFPKGQAITVETDAQPATETWISQGERFLLALAENGLFIGKWSEIPGIGRRFTFYRLSGQIVGHSSNSLIQGSDGYIYAVAKRARL